MSNESLGTPINNYGLTDQVIDRITTALIHKELKPGDKLPTENELVALLKVGRSSVREAIKVLQAMGVVEVRRGDGTYVSSQVSGIAVNPMLYQLLLERGTMEDLLELRVMFEPAYTLLAARKATEEDFKSIKEAQQHCEKLALQNKHTGDDDIAFHTAILHATHNPYVIRIGEVILKVFMESINRSSTQSPSSVIEDHRKIYDALLSRNETALNAAVLHSFQGWIQHQDMASETKRGG